jgi:hypothetical protein
VYKTAKKKKVILKPLVRVRYIECVCIYTGLHVYVEKGEVSTKFMKYKAGWFITV